MAAVEISVEKSERAVRDRFGRRLRRLREGAGLSQAEAAERLGVSQQIVSRAENKGVASEELLEAVWGLCGVRENYPLAPKDPVRRKVWFDARGRHPGFSARSEVVGAGKVPG